jgi:hypothetical protein
VSIILAHLRPLSHQRANKVINAELRRRTKFVRKNHLIVFLPVYIGSLAVRSSKKDLSDMGRCFGNGSSFPTQIIPTGSSRRDLQN